MESHNDRSYPHTYPMYNVQTREAQMYFGGSGQDSTTMGSSMQHIQAFYPQGHPLRHIAVPNQNNFGPSSEQQHADMMNF